MIKDGVFFVSYRSQSSEIASRIMHRRSASDRHCLVFESNRNVLHFCVFFKHAFSSFQQAKSISYKQLHCSSSNEIWTQELVSSCCSFWQSVRYSINSSGVHTLAKTFETKRTRATVKIIFAISNCRNFDKYTPSTNLFFSFLIKISSFDFVFLVSVYQTNPQRFFQE